MNKQPEVTDATREALVDAFFKAARKKNIDQITIKEITDLAGYNRTTFYRYFVDVYALVEYAEDEFLKSTKKALDEQFSGNNFGEKQFFEIIINRFHENADRISILISEQNHSHFLRRIKEIITNNENVFGKNTPKKAVVRDIYFYGIFYAISINLQSKNSLSDEDLLDIIQQLHDNWFKSEMEKNN